MADRTCSIAGCERAVKARGLCMRHYRSFRRSADWHPMSRTTPRFCTIGDCGEAHYAKGYCERHYYRIVTLPRVRRRTSDQRGGPQMWTHPPRFAVDHRSGCWNWLLHKNEFGYGMSSAKNVDGTFGGTAHRRYLEFMMGHSVPDDMHVDHLCRNTSCVNPAHMEIVTPAENNRRRVLAMKERQNARQEA